MQAKEFRFRIIERDNSFVVQYKYLLFWIDVQSIAEMPIEFETKEAAEDAIVLWQQERTNE